MWFILLSSNYTALGSYVDANPVQVSNFLLKQVLWLVMYIELQKLQ